MSVVVQVIGQLVVCNCVDASKGGGNGHQCKHVLFVFLRVLGVSKDSHIVNQKVCFTPISNAEPTLLLRCTVGALICVCIYRHYSSPSWMKSYKLLHPTM